MRLSLSALLFPLLAAFASRAFANGEFRLPGRAGLHNLPGLLTYQSELLSLSGSGWIYGVTAEANGGRAAWATNPADGISRRIDTIFGFYQIVDVTESGYILGESLGTGGFYQWIAEGATGRNMTSGIGSVKALTESGFAWGVNRLNGNAETVWVMDCRTGRVTRAGLFMEPAYSGLNGAQKSEGSVFSESGWLGGTSARFHNGGGTDAWVTHAVTGVTRGLGWPGMRRDWIRRITENGRVMGNSQGKPGEDFDEETMVGWVADAVTGATHRVGLYEGAEFTEAVSGRQSGGVTIATESGWIAGSSQIFKPAGFDLRAGTAAWVSDDRGGAVRRVGLFQSREFIHDRDGPESGVWWLTEKGWAIGSSRRFRVDPDGRSSQGGQAVWAADASTGATRRLGFTGGDFRGRNGHEESALLASTESGWVTGWSGSYRDANGELSADVVRRVPWVTRASGGETWPVGLTGPEAADSYIEVKGVTEAGVVFGHNTRSNYPDGEVWCGAWMADAATGVVTRIGLTGENFTQTDGRQVSKILKWTKSGYIFGDSIGYSGGDASRGEIRWAADIRTGRTWRLGPVDGDTRAGETHHFTEDGLVAGNSWSVTRPPDFGRAWVTDVKTGKTTVFDPGRRPSDGHVRTTVKGITAGGMVYGLHTVWINELESQERPFLWADGMGVFVSGGTAQGGSTGYEFLTDIRVSDTGLAAAPGWTGGGRSRGVWFGPVASLLSPRGGVRVTDFGRAPGGNFRLSLRVNAATRVTLQSSTDLTTWRDVKAVDVPAGASHMDLEPDSAAGPDLYWRLKTGP